MSKMSALVRRIVSQRAALAACASRPAALSSWPAAPRALAAPPRASFSAAPARERVPLRDKMWDKFVQLLRLKASFFAISTAVMAGGGVYLYTTRTPAANVEAASNAFERGAVGGGAWPEDATVIVERAVLEEQLLPLLRSEFSDKYGLVCGEHGTGKSTAVRKAARKLHADGANGVVYFSVDEVSNFTADLASVIGHKTNVVDMEESMVRALMKIIKAEEVLTWPALKKDIKAGALQFYNKYKRPATLVLDNVDIIAKKDPEFLIDLQRFAKAMADEHILRVIFVSSDGTAPALMKGQSEWGRALDPLEVGDISDADALSYLKSRGSKPSVAGA